MVKADSFTKVFSNSPMKPRPQYEFFGCFRGLSRAKPGSEHAHETDGVESRAPVSKDLPSAIYR